MLTEELHHIIWRQIFHKLFINFQKQTGCEIEKIYQSDGLGMTPNFSGLVSTENVWFWLRELTFQSWERKGDILYLKCFNISAMTNYPWLHNTNTEDWKLFGFISSLFPTAISWNCFSGVKPITEQLAAIALLKLPNVFKELGGRSRLF